MNNFMVKDSMSILGRPNSNYWWRWMYVATFLPRRLLYGCLLLMVATVARREKLSAEDAESMTVSELADTLFEYWKW